jgi:hypothetical protein
MLLINRYYRLHGKNGDTDKNSLFLTLGLVSIFKISKSAMSLTAS